MRDTAKTETDSRVGEVGTRPEALADEPVSRAEYTRELAELRAEVRRLGAGSGLAPARAGRARFDTRTGDPTPRRQRRRARDASMVQTAERGAPVSRRRLFGLLGGAAAVGTGLAVAGSALGADPAGATAVTAGAANGDALQIGGSNACTGNTGLTSTTASAAFDAVSTGANGTGIEGTCNNGTKAVGVFGFSSTGIGLYAQGGLAPLFLVPHGVGAPTTGTHQIGEFVVDSNGTLFTCVAAGTPGTWLRQSPLVAIPPARVYDSRASQSPTTGPKATITNGSTVNVDVTGIQATPPGGASGVPSGAKSVLGNITVVNGPNPVFLTVFAEGATPPATSNVNAGGGVVVANSFTSTLGTSNGISIKCGGGPTDFIIDIFGYYP
jgi:hypothetical protein